MQHIMYIRTCFGHDAVGMLDDSVHHDAVVGSPLPPSLDSPLVDPHDKWLGTLPCHLDEGSTGGTPFC